MTVTDVKKVRNHKRTILLQNLPTYAEVEKLGLIKNISCQNTTNLQSIEIVETKYNLNQI